MTEQPRQTREEQAAEPPAAADTDEIDEAAEPATHPDAPRKSAWDEVGELLEKAEGNVW